MTKVFNKQEYDNQYAKDNYYSPKLSLPKRYKEILHAKAKEYDSMTKYIQHLIDADISRGGEQLLGFLKFAAGRLTAAPSWPNLMICQKR